MTDARVSDGDLAKINAVRPKAADRFHTDCYEGGCREGV